MSVALGRLPVEELDVDDRDRRAGDHLVAGGEDPGWARLAVDHDSDVGAGCVGGVHGECLPPVSPLPNGADRESVTLGVPVVFLILPVTILFALYPGASYLNFTL